MLEVVSAVLPNDPFLWNACKQPLHTPPQQNASLPSSSSGGTGRSTPTQNHQCLPTGGAITATTSSTQSSSSQLLIQFDSEDEETSPPSPTEASRTPDLPRARNTELAPSPSKPTPITPQGTGECGVNKKLVLGSDGVVLTVSWDLTGSPSSYPRRFLLTCDPPEPSLQSPLSFPSLTQVKKKERGGW